MDAIKKFGARLRETFEKGRKTGKLASVGNFSIVVHETAVWTVLTKGPQAGVHEAMTDDKMDFIMITTLDIFEKMYPMVDGEVPDLDVDQIIEENKIAMHGNIDVFLRFIAINGAADMLSLRANGANGSAKPAKKRTRPL